MLLEETLKFRAMTEEDAKDKIESYRAEADKKGYTIKKAGYEYKSKKAKGEVIAEMWVVSVTLIFADLWEDLI